MRSLFAVGASLCVLGAAAAQGLSPGQTMMVPSAAPSNLGNASSIVPGAAASDIGHPSSIVPGAAASDARQFGIEVTRAGTALAPTGRNQLPLAPAAVPQQFDGIIRSSTNVTETKSIDRVSDVFSAVRACWHPPRNADAPARLQATVRMSFKRSGEVMGKPRITYKGAGERSHQELLMSSIMTAFNTCGPLPFTKSFGSAVAGRPFTFRFVDDRKT